ncbi:MAG: hypothetical protein Q8N52_06670, partial [Acidobacteriota bacterium]|nr:hypothetical protein [Acidobacteriota bacterium]
RGAALDQAAEEALTALLDARGSMYAYIAPGQGTSFWGGRAGTLLDTLRQRVVTLDAEVAGSGGSLSESLDGIDQLAAADRRARQYADRGELLLAGDVLFSEVRDLLNGLTEQVTAARYALRNQSDVRVAAIRQEQAALAAAGIGLWVIVSLMLLPGSKREAVKDPTEWRQELATTLKVTPSASAPEKSEELRRDLAEAAFGGEGGPPAAPVVVAATPQIDLKTVAEICSDLSALADIGALSGALARASDSLGAKGLIVWVISNDGSALSPVSTHGFDARIVDRIGTINRASANLTAEALRENAPRVSAATATAGAAIAVPMCGPTGPVGVLSAELHAGKTADEASVAIASIFAAQLATLTAPLPAAAGAERSVESAAS